MSGNVNRVTDRLTSRNAQIVTLSTLRTMAETYFAAADPPTATEPEDAAARMSDLYEMLVKVRPELVVVPLEARVSVRRQLLVDQAVMMHGYAALMRQYTKDLGADGRTATTKWRRALNKLAATATYRDEHWTGDFFSRTNPLWQRVGVLQQTKTGGLAVSNTRQTREVVSSTLLDRISTATPTAHRSTPKSMTDEEAFDAWLASRKEHLARAQDDLAQQVDRFAADWAEAYSSRTAEKHDRGAVKGRDRILDKCVAKAITTDFDQLLTDQSPPVGDLVRTRLVFRSQADVDAFRIAAELNWPLGATKIEDFIVESSSTGYRALHVNGALSVRIRDELVLVPYEVQVKTLAQDAWGRYTHDSSYVPTEINTHPRWGHVRVLQQVLSDQLNVVDQLQEQIEISGEEIAHDIAEGADPNELMFANVRSSIQEQYETACSIGNVQRPVRRAREQGLSSMDEFTLTVNPARPEAEAFSATFREAPGKPPSAYQIAAELLTQPRTTAE